MKKNYLLTGLIVFGILIFNEKVIAQKDSILAEKIARFLFVEKNYPVAVKMLKTVDIGKSKYMERLLFLEVYCLYYSNQKELSYQKGLEFFNEKKEFSFDDHQSLYSKLVISQFLVANYLKDKDYTNALLLLFKEEQLLTGVYQTLFREGLPFLEMQRRNRMLSNICRFILGDDTAIPTLINYFLLLNYADYERKSSSFFATFIEDGERLSKIETYLYLGEPLFVYFDLIGKEYEEALPYYGIDLMKLVVDRVKMKHLLPNVKNYICGLDHLSTFKLDGSECVFISIGDENVQIGKDKLSVEKTIEIIKRSYFYKHYLREL